MSLSNGDDFQENHQSETGNQSEEIEMELEAGPRAERPNFLTATRFADFELPPEILEGIDKAGFEYCTPIQAQAIPVAMQGNDIAGQAQTGTGKTTAFLVPLLNRLLTNKPIAPDVPRAIIITPTRELALQIHEDATVLAGGTNLRQALVIGGMDYKEQAELLAAGPEIVICTPGRIIDYLQQGVFKTNGIEITVVDEADRLLDMGFIKDIKYLLSKLPLFTKRQTMLFSATLDERVLELTYQYMNPPQYITAEPDTTTKINIVQELYHVGREEKLPLLLGLLRREEHQRVMIFVNTKSGVEWLSKKLVMNGIQTEGITGDLPQPKRLKLMEAFKENKLQILVATDVASRGIHVDNVSHVYNYDLPQDAENYVHRIGRTARAGNTGKAISFGCEDYVFHLEAIENLLGEKIPVFWAEADCFHADQGGEVRLKRERGKNDRRRDSASFSKPGRNSDSSDRSPSRGPAKSHRPGGIFGLSPRITGNGEDDIRQTLNWLVLEEPKPSAGLVIEEKLSPGENGETNEWENSRRRKRRRGRRGRGADSQAATDIKETASTPPEGQTETPPAAKEDQPPAPEAAAPVAEVIVAEEQKSDSAQSKIRKYPTRKSVYKKPKVAETASETKIEATPSPSLEPKEPAAEPQKPVTVESASPKAAKKRPSRPPKKTADEAEKPQDKTKPEKYGLEQEGAAAESKPKKPKRAPALPKTAAAGGEENKAAQAPVEKPTAKKTSRAPRKASEAAGGATKKSGAVAAKTPKVMATKKAVKTPKSAENKKAESAGEVTGPKTSGGSAKKEATPEEKPKKSVSKRPAK